MTYNSIGIYQVDYNRYYKYLTKKYSIDSKNYLQVFISKEILNIDTRIWRNS